MLDFLSRSNSYFGKIYWKASSFSQESYLILRFHSFCLFWLMHTLYIITSPNIKWTAWWLLHIVFILTISTSLWRRHSCPDVLWTSSHLTFCSLIVKFLSLSTCLLIRSQYHFHWFQEKLHHFHKFQFHFYFCNIIWLS